MYPISYLEKYCPLSSLATRKNCYPEENVRSQTDRRTTKPAIFSLTGFPSMKAYCYTRLKDLPLAWDQVTASAPALLQRPFLSGIAEAPPLGMDFRYLVFHHEDNPIGIAYYQILSFEAERSLRFSDKSTGASRLKKWVARQFHNTLLFAGNTILTGQHAYYFQPGVLSSSTQLQLLEQATWDLATHLRHKGHSIDAIVHKDIAESQLPSYDSWRQSGYHALRFQPNMQIRLRPEWHSFDDYLDAMSSKYRVRARRAGKKSSSLKRRWLPVEEIREHTDRMYDLYRQVADQAEFNLVQLHPDYFTRLKEKMGERFEVLAYFDKNKMVGFCTLLHNGAQAEAHFLGYDSALNRPRQLYLSMLYDLVQAGIERKKTHIGFARTALAIKSSIGAEPEEMFTLVRSYNSLPNRIIPPIVKFLEPQQDWERRRPFRVSP